MLLICLRFRQIKDELRVISNYSGCGQTEPFFEKVEVRGRELLTPTGWYGVEERGVAAVAGGEWMLASKERLRERAEGLD
jgi:hypothetical protein